MEALQYCTMYDFRCSSFQSPHQEPQLSKSVTAPLGGPTHTSPIVASCSPCSTTSQSQNFSYYHGNNPSTICATYTTGKATVNNNTTTMDTLNTDMIDPNLEPTPRNRCNTWPLRPVEPPSTHDSESNHADTVIKEEEPEDFNELDDESQAQNNLSSGQDHLGISNQIGINNSSELGSQGDLNAKKQSARKNAWGECYCNLKYF